MATKKIILVDDKASYRKTLKNILKMIGDVEIIGEAENGEEYLELLDKMTPDVTFMDIEMPVMDGIEATKRAILKNKDLVIIGVSLYSNDKYVEHLIKAGARGYLLKLSNNFTLFKNIIKHPNAEIFFSEQIETKIKSGSKTKKRTIMIFDDFETNTMVIESTLVTAGYKVLKALNAEEALKHAYNDSNNIDLVIADFNMPGKNGAELIDEFKKISKYRSTPAIILSSDDSPEKKQLAKKAGATGWMKKPFILKQLLKVVESDF